MTHFDVYKKPVGEGCLLDVAGRLAQSALHAVGYSLVVDGAKAHADSQSML